jgi:ribosomal protein S27AE
MNGGFMDGFGAAPPPRPAPRVIGTGTWSPGQHHVAVQAVCCPQCGSLHVAVRDNGRSDAVQRWECGDCQCAWKMPAGTVRRCWYPG